MTRLEELKKAVEDNKVAQWIVNNFEVLPELPIDRCDGCPREREDFCGCIFSDEEDMDYWLNLEKK